MSAEEKKAQIKEMAEVLEELGRDDLMKTMGFALGLKAKEEPKEG